MTITAKANLLNATAVQFGSTPAASFTVNSATQTVAVSPAGVVGPPLALSQPRQAPRRRVILPIKLRLPLRECSTAGSHRTSSPACRRPWEVSCGSTDNGNAVYGLAGAASDGPVDGSLVVVGFPFGLSVGGFPPVLPLPAKVTMELLEPIDLRARHGADPDVEEIYHDLMATMQETLTALQRERRLPVLG